MKQHLKILIESALQTLKKQNKIPQEVTCEIPLERARNKQHGDFASSCALALSKILKRSPLEIAEMIVQAMPKSEHVANITVANPGFINFQLHQNSLNQIVKTILSEPENYGRTDFGKGVKIILEYVSANPTGPLHVGHGRGAAFGASLAQLLKMAGFSVFQEYYVNDAGRQMDILAVSVWLRYLESFQVTTYFPTNGYRGDYVRDISLQLKQQYHDQFVRQESDILAGLVPDEPQGGDKEEHVDSLIAHAKQLLGPDFRIVHRFGLQMILDDIRDDLKEFKVEFDNWYSEQDLTESQAVDQAIAKLQQSEYVYEKDGALWFNSIHFGDEKDRVLIRANGQKTYFAPDVAYHMDKYQRGFDRLINIFGADHHGYITRVKAAMSAMGFDANRLNVFLVQFAILYRGGERVQMSTRSGSFITLRELREEVGNDAARFFYVWRKCDQHMDFDLDLAKSQSADNPVYYIQYAHARVCSVFRQLQTKQMVFDQSVGLANLSLLSQEHEKGILMTLSRYPEVIHQAAEVCEPHQIAHYLRELAQDFHTYYNSFQFIVEDDALRNARLCLILAVRYTIANGLKILGVSQPENM